MHLPQWVEPEAQAEVRQMAMEAPRPFLSFQRLPEETLRTMAPPQLRHLRR